MQNLKRIYLYFPHSNYYAIVFFHVAFMYVINPTTHCYSFYFKQLSFNVILKTRSNKTMKPNIEVQMPF